MADAECRLAGYGVVRVCATPVSALAGLSSPKTAGLADELRLADEAWRAIAVTVADELTALVPRLEDRSLRRATLALRRRLHRGGDVPEADLRALLDATAPVGGPADDGLRRLEGLAATRADLLARLETEYDASWSDEQRVLAALTAEPHLRTSAQLTAAGMLHNLDRFAADVAAGTSRGKRARTTEATLVNLVARSALKPSPFGRLVHTAPVLFDGAPSERTPPVRSVCRLPRQLVSWVERVLADHPDLADVAVLRRAPVVATSARGTVFLVRGRDGTHEPASTERFVRVPPDPVLAAVLELPADLPVPEGELRRRCADAAPDGEARLAQLLAQGVLARDLGVGDQEPDPMARLARLLPPGCDARLRELVTELADVQSVFGDADPPRRDELLAGIGRRVTELADACAAPQPPMEAARTLMYEDAVVAEPRLEPRERWEAHLPALGLLHRLVPLFDDDAHVRVVVADLVLRRFGPGPHRLLTLYSVLSAPKLRAELAERLVDLSADVPTQLRRLQDAVLCGAGERTEDELVLDPAHLTAVADGLPAWVSRWRRVSWHVQRHTTQDAEHLVVNGSSVGYGRAISRFCTAYDAAGTGDAAGFTDAVRADIAADDDPLAPLTDLSAALGINANVHPPLLGAHLRYPCGTPQEWGSSVGLSLEDCWAEVDPATGGLLLRHGRTGPPLRLVMLNFLLNDLAPQFYRFLNFFGVGSLANLAWWDRVDQRGPREQVVRGYPRVRVGGVVLARRTWKVPVAELPDLTGLDGVAALRAVRGWRAALGLPEQVFCRSFTLPDPLVPASQDEQARWARTLARFPTSAERKPAFLDFTSVTSVRSWQRSLRRFTEDLTFQECLPVPGADGDRHPCTREFTIETTGGGRA